MVTLWKHGSVFTKRLKCKCNILETFQFSWRPDNNTNSQGVLIFLADHQFVSIHYCLLPSKPAPWFWLPLTTPPPLFHLTQKRRFKEILKRLYLLHSHFTPSDIPALPLSGHVLHTGEGNSYFKFYEGETWACWTRTKPINMSVPNVQSSPVIKVPQWIASVTLKVRKAGKISKVHLHTVLPPVQLDLFICEFSD